MSTTALHGKNSVFLSDQYDLSAYYKTFSFKHSKKAEESTVFGLSDRTFVPGMQSGTVSGGGLFRGAASAADADTVLRAALGDSTSGQVLTVGAGGFAIGKRCRLWQSRVTSYDLNVNHDGLIATSFESSSNDGLDAGVSLHDHATAETSSTNSASVDQAAASTKGAIAHLHVIGSATGTADIIVEHSTDDSSWATLITFTQVSAAGSQRMEVASGVTINRYVRVKSTLATTPSFYYAVAFSRRLDVDTASYSVELLPQGGSAPKHAFETLPTSFTVDISNDGLVTFSSEFQNTGAVTDTGTGSAAAGVHGKGTVIKIDDNKGNALVAVTDKGRTWTLKRQRKEEDSTVFGKSRMNNVQGLKTSTMSYAGVWDPTIDEHFAGLLG